MFTCLLCWLNIGLLCGGHALVQLWPDQHSGSLNNLEKALPSLLLHPQIVRTRTITIGPVSHPLFLNSDEKKMMMKMMMMIIIVVVVSQSLDCNQYIDSL